VVADAYYLPWVPYRGRQHTGHSFLATLDAEGLRIVDAYHNDTPWGSARPGIRRLPAAELVSALADTTVTVIRFAPVAGSGTDIGSGDMEPPDPHTVSRYIAAYQTWDDRRAALDGLVLQTWLLARERGLYAARAGGPVRAAHAAAWEGLARKTYVGARRVALGRPEPGGILDDLEALLRAEQNLEAAADASAATRPSPGTAAGRGLSTAMEERVSDAVRNAVRAVMGIPADRLTATASAGEPPEFSSFQLVRILERIERELDVVIPAEQLAPEDLRDVPSLRELFVRCLRGQPTHA
jgi:acyl carrier protein